MHRAVVSGMRLSRVLAALAIVALSGYTHAADAPNPKPEKDQLAGTTMQKTDAKPITTASGLQYIDFKVGDGASPQSGQTALVHYTGWLDDGKKFDSSRDRGKPFGFKVAAGQVIKGWDEGVASMKIGGVRRLIIPPELGYGARGAGGAVPPNARLTFDVELLEIRP
ncbi:MAG: FKBP-type peptidyl-prolyl cis-trans isomerase [Deltaproteobacteria bacterium]|nr:FKBP-type peptidyl-prolyl cis-trans isomerase [Deltaproteobacteria bacterium]